MSDNFSSGNQKVTKNNEEVVSLGWIKGHIRHCRYGKLQGGRNHVKGMNLRSTRGWQERGRWAHLRVNLKLLKWKKLWLLWGKSWTIG